MLREIKNESQVWKYLNKGRKKEKYLKITLAMKTEKTTLENYWK